MDVQAGLLLFCSQTTKDRFSRVKAHMDTGSFVKKISSTTCHCGASSRGVQLEHTDNFQPPCLMLAQCCIDRTTGFCNIRSVGPHRTTGLRIVCLSVTQREGNMKLFHTCLRHANFTRFNSCEKTLIYLNQIQFVCLFVALRPKSTAMVIAGRSVHLTTLFPGQA